MLTLCLRQSVVAHRRTSMAIGRLHVNGVAAPQGWLATTGGSSCVCVCV
jgi:hypothetical protein